MTQKKNLVRYDYHLGHVDLQRVNEEKDLGVTITSKFNVGNSSSHGLG